MEDNLKLTTVKVEKGLYSKFKAECATSNFTLQRLVNRSLDLYENDEEFRNRIKGHQKLQEEHKTKKL